MAGTRAPAGGEVRPGALAESVLRRIEWTVIRRLDGLLQGDYRTLFRGYGLDLADLREYQPDDDVRYIDWNVTARLQVPHVREFHEEREVAAWFLVDLSGSIDFGSGAVRKRTLAAEFVAVVGRLLTRHGNRIGAMLYTGAVDAVLPPRAGRRQVLHLLDRMLRSGPQTRSETDLTEMMDRALRSIRRRSVVFVVSDFISRPGWERGLGVLARRHEIVAVRLYDPLEVALPDAGLVVLEDAETGSQLFVDTHDPGFRRRFAAAAEAREEALRKALLEAGVDCMEMSTDESLVEALVGFTTLRKQRTMLSGGASAHARRQAASA